MDDSKYKILVILNARNYVVNLFRAGKMDLSFSYYKLNLIQKIMRRLWHIFHIRKFDRWYQFTEKNIKIYDIIILCECTYHNDIIKYIRKYNIDGRIIYWLWNPVDKMKDRMMYSPRNEFYSLLNYRYKDEYKCEIWSFDKGDCKKYNLNYNNQVSYKLDLPLGKNIYDMFFCGQDKGRLKLLRKIELECKKLGITYKFIVLCDNKCFIKNSEIEIISKPLPYEKIIGYEMKSKCILDLVQDGQKGLTRRPLEAIFYNKKLITDFEGIISYDFYDLKNVFLLGKDNLLNLKKFIDGEYRKIPEEIIKEYLIDGWIDHFVRNENNEI